MKYYNRINLRVLAVISLLALFVAGCKDDPADPTGDFSFTVSSDNTLSVSFAASGADADAVTWDFGDGETSTSIRPVHTYAAGGTYTVTLTLFGASGSTPAKVTQAVVVVDSPVAGFTFVKEYMMITFTNTTTYADSYSWDFGDGETSTDENPVHTYAAAGDYTVTLNVTGAAGSNPSSVSKTVSPSEVPFTAIAIENGDFQLPGTGKIPNWETVPGWSSDTQVNDSGVDGPDGNGNFWGYLWNKEPEVYQLTNHVIAEGEEYKITLDAWDAWSGGDNFTVTLYYNNGDGIRQVIETHTFETLGTGLEFVTMATSASVGGRLGIQLKANAIGNLGWLNNGWTAFDNVKLFVR
ncbi:PKD domain-containing protein [Mangrovibacterium diazotrophicum]|uniref:PKD domain-containing protein n=1 Tax=Mangrovibacterium diazotrophicum TaxID=1261403 RepID=A0A419W617_9BACT|nr:PKD domain-containing protein [Mangrovibacterium diazotrophicum]RKD90908.1 PKD domain-containing protein [Mangrovibacterium diazotrophicum]